MNEIANEKIGSIIKLGLWLIFIIILFLLSNFSDKKEIKHITDIKDNINEKLSYDEILNNLNNNFEYEYFIRIGNNEYNYVGKRLEKENGFIQESGFCTKKIDDNNNELFNYYIDNGYTYKVENGGLDKIDTIYEGINENYVEINKIKDIIKNKEYVVENNIYSYNIDEINLKIYIIEDSINKIEINTNEDNYILTFGNIGLVKDIKY